MAQIKTSEHGAFDGLRLAAALSVLFSHCYALTGREPIEPLSLLTHGGVGFGGGAVYVFFAISGYLVTQSWFRDPSPARFMMRRALRILPALIFVIAASVFILGPLLSRLSVATYFQQRETWTYLLKMFIYPPQYGLPGVFENNTYQNAVNGSLWSLRLEFALYLILAGMGYAGFLRRRWVNVSLALGSDMMVALIMQTDLLNGIPYIHQTTALFQNAAPFFAGAALAETTLDKKFIGLTVLLSAVTLLLVGTHAFLPVLLLALPFAVIFIARFGTCDLSRAGDYSYGIYLWAFPMQQSVIHFLPDIKPAPLFFIAGAAAFACAFVSWHLIEKQALKLKPRRKRLTNVESLSQSSTI